MSKKAGNEQKPLTTTFFTAEAIAKNNSQESLSSRDGVVTGTSNNNQYSSTSSEGAVTPQFSWSCLWKCGGKLASCVTDCVPDSFNASCIACLGGSWNKCKNCL